MYSLGCPNTLEFSTVIRIIPYITLRLDILPTNLLLENFPKPSFIYDRLIINLIESNCQLKFRKKVTSLEIYNKPPYVIYTSDVLTDTGWCLVSEHSKYIHITIIHTSPHSNTNGEVQEIAFITGIGSCCSQVEVRCSVISISDDSIGNWVKGFTFNGCKAIYLHICESVHRCMLYSTNVVKYIS